MASIFSNMSLVEKYLLKYLANICLVGKKKKKSKYNVHTLNYELKKCT